VRARMASTTEAGREGLGPGTTGGEARALSPGRIAAAARRPGQFVERLLVKEGSHVHVIPADQLDYLEAQDDYVAIHSAGKSHLKACTLAELSAGLDPDRFVRIHRSYVLNIERLGRLELYAKDSRVAFLADGRELPVSGAGYARLRELL